LYNLDGPVQVRVLAHPERIHLFSSLTNAKWNLLIELTVG